MQKAASDDVLDNASLIGNTVLAKKKEGINTFYSNFKHFGFTKSYIKKYFLPGWWSDRMLKTESGFQEFFLHISQKTGISLSALQKSSVPFASESHVFYKHQLFMGTKWLSACKHV